MTLVSLSVTKQADAFCTLLLSKLCAFLVLADKNTHMFLDLDRY